MLAASLACLKSDYYAVVSSGGGGGGGGADTSSGRAPPTFLRAENTALWVFYLAASTVIRWTLS